MRVLAVSSQVVWGPVGNSAAVPALQARGHEVLGLPTITLSNHPGHGQPAGFRTQADDMARMLAALESLGALNNLDAVMTGYFATAGQVDEVARLLTRVDVPLLLVDPVMGDHGRLYVPEDVAQAIARDLVPRATCLTPNGFELARLSGMDVTDAASATAAARALGIPEVLATSIPAEGGRLTTLLVTGDDVHTVTTAKRDGVPHGTGDFLSGLYLAARLSAPPKQAFADAMKTLARAIALSAGTPVLDVAGALHTDRDGASESQVFQSFKLSATSHAAEAFVGIDGCPGGWVVVRWDGSSSSSPTVQFLGRIDELDLSDLRACAIDIPIGFMDVATPGGRQADTQARAFLKGKASSIFSAPARKALDARDFREALEINIKNSQPPGVGLSKQSAALIPKMKEVDDFITPARQGLIFESHPEVAFALMNGRVALKSRKRSRVGADERRRLLVTNGFPVDKLTLPRHVSTRWAQDDLLDACACAWSAKRIAEGRAFRLPADPPRDARGLRMEINA